MSQVGVGVSGPGNSGLLHVLKRRMFVGKAFIYSRADGKNALSVFLMVIPAGMSEFQECT